MHRMPLSDQLPYRFYPPRLTPYLVRATRPYRRRLLRREHRIEEFDFGGIEHLAQLLGRGDGILLAANHPDRADGLVLMHLADRLDRPFYAMSAHQVFAGTGGVRYWLFPRLGIFPVDREGSDLSAFKTGVEIL